MQGSCPGLSCGWHKRESTTEPSEHTRPGVLQGSGRVVQQKHFPPNEKRKKRIPSSDNRPRLAGGSPVEAV